MTPERIAEALARIEAPPPPPWSTSWEADVLRQRLAHARVDLPDALADLAELRAEVERLRAALRDLLASGVEHDDPRIGYVTMQVDRVTLDAARAALADGDLSLAPHGGPGTP